MSKIQIMSYSKKKDLGLFKDPSIEIKKHGKQQKE